MKVLQINAVNKVASTGRTAYELNEYLLNMGQIGAVAYSQGSSWKSEKEYVIGNMLDVKLHGLLSRVFGKQGYYSHCATRKLLKYVTMFAPDVVVLRNLHGNYINLPMLLSYLAKNDIATVAVLHDCWFYTGKCCHYTCDGCFKWKESCGDCPSLKKYNKSWFFDRTARMLEDKKELFGAIPRLAVVGVSDWITDEARQAPVFKNAKIFKRIYNWIDTEKFSPQNTDELRERMGLEDKRIILCVASGWSREKGLDKVIRLSERLADDERIVLVGNLPESARLNGKIIHIPATNSVDELVSYYSMADVFFQPSPEETFGKVTAEALSCGTPAVCFDSTANPELIGEGCGAVIEVGDDEKLISEIRNVLKAGKSAYTDNCRAYAERSFNKNANLDQYMKLFSELSGEK